MANQTSPLCNLLRTYDIPCPGTMKPLRILLEELMDLKKESPTGVASDNCDRMINSIKSFGVIAEDKCTDNRPVTTRQWARLRNMMTKVVEPSNVPSHVERYSMPDIPPLTTTIGSYYSSQSSNTPRKDPTKLYRINMFELAPEAAQLLMSLLESINTDNMSSTITAAILDFFTLAGILGETGQDYSDLLEPVNRVLQFHGWTGGGFNSPPNVKNILHDLNAVMGAGIVLPV